MPGDDIWLPNPPDGTLVCGGFDGSENDDWTAIRLETVDGLLFTPRYGPDRRPTIWNPAEWSGKTPRGEVHAAWEEINRRYKVGRAYCDPGFMDEVSWKTEIETWDQIYGPKKFIPWVMSGSSRYTAVHAALRRFEADLESRAIRHDGCPITDTHVGNARRIAKPGERYALGKPSQNQKIDAAVTSVLAHEAACDARSEGWGQKTTTYIYTSRTTRRR
ncbi:hypothetical protein GCM10025864_39470 [Luteimicrobium album]|uniref:Terminase n=1 Tax=Luteimicrobium album TaxID=1054550 RepID=A0ABQ6I5X4_9MICO|nr:terminase [Luteimicrobium album]GMA26188.1 hypothetical protein GCM10025864_39470 [Luteimicrobium album]